MISLAHSHLHFNGQTLPEGVEYLSALMKDSQQKGYYIRLVDTKVRDHLVAWFFWHVVERER